MAWLFVCTDIELIDELSVEKWRAETVKAVVNFRDFRLSEAEDSKKILETAKKILHHWLRSTGFLDKNLFEKHMGRFKQDIHTPAIELLQTMRTSIRQYGFKDVVPSRKFISDQTLDQCTVKDVNTWAPVKKSKSHEQVLQFLCCLHPKLIRLGMGSGGDIELVKPVIVILVSKLEKDMAREWNG